MKAKEIVMIWYLDLDFLSKRHSHPIIAETRQYVLLLSAIIMRKIFVLHEEKKDPIGKQFPFRENKIKTIHKFENNFKSPF